MKRAESDGQAGAVGDAYRALLAVSEVITSHRDLSALFHELAGRLHQLVRFDYLALIMHEAATNTLRLHVLEPPEPASVLPGQHTPLEESPAELVRQSQRPLIISNVSEEKRWPKLMERARSWGVQSSCELPLTARTPATGTGAARSRATRNATSAIRVPILRHRERPRS